LPLPGSQQAQSAGHQSPSGRLGHGGNGGGSKPTAVSSGTIGTRGEAGRHTPL
jgi:hypothetical protein